MVIKETADPPPKHKDNEGVLLTPDLDNSMIAVLNPALRQGKSPWPFFYRTIRLDESGREYSTIDFTYLENPTTVRKGSRILISPENNYEIMGCEDPRISDDLITYIAFDGLNAVPALARVNDDFTKVEKEGLLGPNISLEEAIKLVDDPFYKRKWGENLDYLMKSKNEKDLKGEIFPYNKDASLHYDQERGQWVYIFRLEPDIQIAFADDLSYFREKDFWKEHLRNFKDNIIMKAEDCHEKIGLGSPPIKIDGKRIALYHSVELKNEILFYRGGIIEFNENYKVVSKLRDSLLDPNHNTDILQERDTNGFLRSAKAVNFPTAMLQDPKNEDTLWIYYNKGDKIISYRSTSVSWLLEQLNDPHNSLKI